jgi:hypothetical protein
MGDFIPGGGLDRQDAKVGKYAKGELEWDVI